MITTNFVLSLLAVGMTLLSAFSVYLFQILREKRKIEKLKDEGKVMLSYPREKIEKQIYDLTEQYLSNKNHYKEMYHLVLQDDDSKIVIKQKVVDQSFFEKIGLDLTSLAVDDNQVMCLMPFHRRFRKIYESIKQTCASVSKIAVRSDDEFVSGDILKYTIRLILESQIIIAVLDGRNANVFYEIGIAQAVGKTVILVSDISKFQDVPFDLKNNRILLYKDLDDLKEKISGIFKDLTNVDTK